ncbi:hypothetical protein [Moritella viscosa]|uniref:Endoglucanase 1-Cellulase 1-Endo-1,4-beta-glucanase 1 n=1 Tax=Moritella viscosa TaxID=80854 RepID=A0ABY1HJ06_9GAMM|nr:hypothetical protein [Moritella viscosa]SGZ00550.1 Endoglucanase 1-Cellulase 1-Endo-1,4-beta-glucanase 1 [Moritella viscosa]
MEVINVIGAVVSARSRHKDNRQELTVSIPKTQINKEYWGEHVARNLIREELHKQGFNHFFKIISWVH